jgi:limonene-1,2-epoxide hydrolase
MNITTATVTIAEPGPLYRIVVKYCEMMETRATAAGSTAADWEPLSKLVADDFKRVGAYMEVMNWPEYVKFLTEWAGSTRFEMTVFHITEVGQAVFQEIEERHYKGEDFIRKNVIAVYRFNDKNQIQHLDIYEQAKDTGRWIVEAAQASLNSTS